MYNCSVIHVFLGIIVRSCVWLDGSYPGPEDTDYRDIKHSLCIITSVRGFLSCNILLGMHRLFVTTARLTTGINREWLELFFVHQGWATRIILLVIFNDGFTMTITIRQTGNNIDSLPHL